MYKGCVDYLKGLDRSMNQRMGSTPVYKGCVDYLKGLDASMNQRTGSTPLYKGCVDFFEGTRPFNESTHGVYSTVQGVS